MSKIEAAMAPIAVPARVQRQVVVLRPTAGSEFHCVTGMSSWRISLKMGSISPTGLYAASASIKEPLGMPVCISDSDAGDVCPALCHITSHELAYRERLCY